MTNNITKEEIKKFAETSPNKEFTIIYLTRMLLNEFEKTDTQILAEYENI